MKAPAQLSASFRKVIAAILEPLLPGHADLDGRQRAQVYGDVTTFVSAQVHGMPDFLRLPYEAAMLAFNWLPVLRYGRPFTALPPEARQTCLSFWREGPIGPMRDFVKLIQSCAFLAYFDHPLVMEALERQRQQAAEPITPVAASSAS